MSYGRSLALPNTSFFLFGPRGTGKTTWLKKRFANSPYFNLLKNDLFIELARNPTILEAKLVHAKKGTWVCIDEIQKIPTLLDEVHRLIEDKGYKFALSGSSARKLKRQGANLLGGRAITKNMEGFTSAELGKEFHLENILRWGSLPLVVTQPDNKKDILNTYVHTYLREEIKEEGLIRKVEPFIRFLEIAALLNGQQLNVENVSRDAHIPRPTANTYISILQDTLIAHLLPSYRPQAKVREQTSPKLYWFDQGVARAAAGLLEDEPNNTWLGTALETLIYHELRVYNHTQNKNRHLAYYKTSSGLEIDFIIETRKATQENKSHVICLEVKSSKKWDRKWEKPARSLKQTGKISVDRMIGIYGGKERLAFDDYDVLPIGDFLNDLHSGKIF